MNYNFGIEYDTIFGNCTIEGIYDLSDLDENELRELIKKTLSWENISEDYQKKKR